MQQAPVKHLAALALTSSFIGLSGCASDGDAAGVALAAAMIGGDIGSAAAMAAGAYTASAVIDSEGEATPGAANATASAAPSSSPDELRMSADRLLALESPERYRYKTCEYIEVTLETAAFYLASGDPASMQLGGTRKSLASQAWADKGCQRANLPMGRIGMDIYAIDPLLAQPRSLPTTGVVVTSTIPGSPAQQAGMQPWDIVVAIDEQPIADYEDFRVQVGKAAIGSRVALKTWRAGVYSTIQVAVIDTQTFEQLSSSNTAPAKAVDKK